MLRVEYMCVCSRHNGANGWLLHQYVQRLPTAFVTQHAPNASIPTEHVFSCFPRHNCANGWLLHQHVQPMTTAFITNHALNVRTPIPDLWLFFPFEPWKNPNSRSWIWAWVYHISEGNTCTYIKRIKHFTHPCIDILVGQIVTWANHFHQETWKDTHEDTAPCDRSPWCVGSASQAICAIETPYLALSPRHAADTCTPWSTHLGPACVVQPVQSHHETCRSYWLERHWQLAMLLDRW